MKQPSKDWKESVASDENERFTKYAEAIVKIQREKSKKFGIGRGLHRKQILGLKAKLEIIKDIPEQARYGLFAKPANYEVLVRISNGGMNVQKDSVPDIRGFSFKVLGLNGANALGTGNTTSQDFTLINRSTFSFPKVAPFVDLVIAVSEGPLGILKHMIATFGFFGGFKKLGEMAKVMGIPFSGFASENFYTAAPISCGSFAIKVRIKSHQSGTSSPKVDYAEDFEQHLKKGELKFDLQIQFYTDEATTPIEDPSVEWPESETPYITVGILTIPVQELDKSNKNDLSVKIQNDLFDPWNALKEHTPLGDVMRARKYVYYASQKERGAAK